MRAELAFIALNGYYGADFLRCIMTTEQFETWSLYIGVGVLIFFMFFIIYDLGKKSNAGKFGNFILFLALGLGMVGFLIKIFLQYFME